MSRGLVVVPGKERAQHWLWGAGAVPGRLVLAPGHEGRGGWPKCEAPWRRGCLGCGWGPVGLRLKGPLVACRVLTPDWAALGRAVPAGSARPRTPEHRMQNKTCPSV